MSAAFCVAALIKRSLFLEGDAYLTINVAALHCVKSVKIRSFFWSVFSNIPTEYG